MSRAKMSQAGISEQRQPYRGYPYVIPLVTDVVTNDTSLTNTSPTEKSIELRNNREDRVPYQGFPYVNPTRTYARSLTVEELAEFAKWQNLPRRPLGTSYAARGQPPNEENPGSQTEESTTTSKSHLDPDSTPVVYIDIPQGSSGVSDRIGGSSQADGLSGSKDDENRPMIYIDIPDSNSSGVSQTNDAGEPAYVQETIFYDPFKDRRIQLPRHPDSEGSRSLESIRPEPLRSQESVPSGSSGFGSGSSNSSYQHSYLSKETQLYIPIPSLRDELSLSPLPVNDLPFPPPYEEIDSQRRERPQSLPVTEQPRTQVITTPTATEAVLYGLRKVETCLHCNQTVTTLVVRENGFFTHLIAIVFFFMFPLIIMYYMFGCCKYRNHYCPSCNRKIGYQLPDYCCSDTFHFAS